MSKKILGSIIVILIIAVGFYYQSQLSDDIKRIISNYGGDKSEKKSRKRLKIKKLKSRKRL